MMSGFTSAAATLENDPQHGLDGNVKQDRCRQCLSEPPFNHIRVGVLRYNWESDVPKRNLTAIPPESQPSNDYTVKCEYCGERPRPTLDKVCLPDTERQTPLDFCCNQWQRLCQKLKEEICLSSRNSPVNHQMYIDPHESYSYEDTSFHQEQSSVLKEHSVNPLIPLFSLEPSLDLPAVREPFVPESNVLRFTLSSLPVEEWTTLCPLNPKEVDQENEEEQVVPPTFDHKPVRFGLCYHQITARIQKYYSDGSTFLTAFPDGSAHLLPYHRGHRYPSGLLAVIVVPSEQHGRVCIVYDDVCAPHQPMRAIFHSHGHASCNHNNGKIWLMLNSSGGQRFTDVGARVCRWKWSGQTPLHPVFLSLNKMVGVRVLENRQVFVCFLAKGKQAKFSVGPCCAQCESKIAATRPVKQEDEELQSIVSHFYTAAKKLLDCDRTIQNTFLKDS